MADAEQAAETTDTETTTEGDTATVEVSIADAYNTSEGGEGGEGGEGNAESAAAAESGEGDEDDSEDKGSEEAIVYELALPEGAKIDAESVARAEAFAKEHGLTNEAAQAHLEIQSRTVDAVLEQQQTAFNAEVKGWEDELKADPDIGGAKMAEAIGNVKGVIERFGDPDLAEKLRESGLGSHPGFFRMMSKIGAAMAEDTSTGRSVAGKQDQPETLRDFYEK